jgi:hypothetical protein
MELRSPVLHHLGTELAYGKSSAKIVLDMSIETCIERQLVDPADLIRAQVAAAILGVSSPRVLSTLGADLGRVTICGVPYYSRARCVELAGRPSQRFLTAEEVGQRLGLTRARVIQPDFDALLMPQLVPTARPNHYHRRYELSRVLRIAEIRAQFMATGSSYVPLAYIAAELERNQ